jgi:hypothetical protein
MLAALGPALVGCPDEKPAPAATLGHDAEIPEREAPGNEPAGNEPAERPAGNEPETPDEQPGEAGTFGVRPDRPVSQGARPDRPR